MSEKTTQRKLRAISRSLEKSFVIKRVSAFSKNPRNEIRKKMKYYFYDMGLRNAVIDRFQILSNRDNKEIGGMWENFVFMELYKKYLLKIITLEPGANVPHFQPY